MFSIVVVGYEVWWGRLYGKGSWKLVLSDWDLCFEIGIFNLVVKIIYIVI